MATISCECVDGPINRHDIAEEFYDIQLQNNSSKKIINMLVSSLKTKLEPEAPKYENRYFLQSKRFVFKEPEEEAEHECMSGIPGVEADLIGCPETVKGGSTESMLQLLGSEVKGMKSRASEAPMQLDYHCVEVGKRRRERKAMELYKILEDLMDSLHLIDGNIDTLARTLDVELAEDYLGYEGRGDSDEEVDGFYKILDYPTIIEIYELNKQVLGFDNSSLMRAQEKMKAMEKRKWFEFGELAKFIRKRLDGLGAMNELLHEIIRNMEDCNGNLIKNDHTRFVD